MGARRLIPTIFLFQVLGLVLVFTPELYAQYQCPLSVPDGNCFNLTEPEDHKRFYLMKGILDISGSHLYRRTVPSNSKISACRHCVIREAFADQRNLEGVNFSDSNLKGISARRSNLAKANLSRCDLRGAKLHGASLRGAQLKNAQLYAADLSLSDLRGADLRGADLTDAFMLGAQLEGALIDERTKLPPSIDREIFVSHEPQEVDRD